MLHYVTIALVILISIYCFIYFGGKHHTEQFNTGNEEGEEENEETDKVQEETVQAVDPNDTYNYGSITYESSLNDFKKLEDQPCTYIKNTLPNTWKTYDIMNNYRIISHPRYENMCYIKMTDSMMDKGCHINNEHLYKKGDISFKNIVEKVKKTLFIDPYVSKTIPEEVCMMSFKNKKVKQDDMDRVLSYWDENDPKLVKLRKEIEQLKKNIEQKKRILNTRQENVNGLLKEDKELQSFLQKQNEEINRMANEISNVEKAKKTREQSVNNITSSIVKTNNQYIERDNKKVKLCKAIDYEDCRELPLGFYNMTQMKALGLPNDTISSLKVPKGLKLATYEHDHHEGKEKIFDGPAEISFLGDMNDTISSVKVFGASLQ